MVKYQTYKISLPKFGNSAEENEDFYKSNMSEYPDGKIDQIFAAISDGATETSFSKEWAKMLVRGYVNNPTNNFIELTELINESSKKWYKVLSKKKLAWFAEEKASKGAFATFLAVRIYNDCVQKSHCGKWESIAIGDSCLFQIREGLLLKSYPIDRSELFSISPNLISSNIERNTDLQDSFYEDTGNWLTGDTFILATDSISKWILGEFEIRNNPLNLLLELIKKDDVNDFQSWIKIMISEKKIKNDDITITIIKV